MTAVYTVFAVEGGSALVVASLLASGPGGVSLLVRTASVDIGSRVSHAVPGRAPRGLQLAPEVAFSPPVSPASISSMGTPAVSLSLMIGTRAISAATIR